jgi:hypothetical protein
MKNAFQILVVLTAIFGLGLGLAFAGGAWWGRRDAKPATASATPAAGQGAGAAALGGGPPGAGAAAALSGATTGVVEEISGDTITVRTQNGGTVSVKVQGDTQVRQLASATAADIKPGLNVIVQGQPDVDGKLAARSVQITGAAAPAGQGAGQGQTGQGGRPSGARGASPSPAP